MSTHLVVGAGPVGTAIARLLADHGHDVVVLTRSGSGPEHRSITRVRGDASSTELLTRLADRVEVVYNAANPAYHRWATDWPPIAGALLTAAERTGAVLATVSNLYLYGPVDGPMRETTPLRATGTKSQVRARMWLDALAAHDAGRIRMTEVRGSDYLCPGQGSHLGDRVMPALLAGKPVTVLPSADQPHTWTAVEDVARTVVAAATDERGWGRAWHVPSNAPRTQREVIADLCRVVDVPQVTVRQYPRPVLTALGLVVPMLRELREVAHQFERPFVLDSSAAEETFGLTPTPWDQMLAGQVAHYRTPVAA